MRRAMAATRCLSLFPFIFNQSTPFAPQNPSSFFFPFPQTLMKSPLKTTPKPLCAHSFPSRTLTPSPLPPSSSPYSLDLEPHLECSMPGERLRVAVLVSGGVDSSVTLRLLHAAGHSVTAFYLKIWFQEDFENFWSACPWDEDLRYATAVCEKVSYMIDEYRSGRTPNLDVLCNTRIKFG